MVINKFLKTSRDVIVLAKSSFQSSPARVNNMITPFCRSRLIKHTPTLPLLVQRLKLFRFDWHAVDLSDECKYTTTFQRLNLSFL